MGSSWVSTNRGWLKWDIPFISDKPDKAWHQFVPGIVTVTVFRAQVPLGISKDVQSKRTSSAVKATLPILSIFGFIVAK